MVYMSEDDSDLLLEIVKRELFDLNYNPFFLDMGTGSGIISLNIFNKVKEVYAVDIDQKSINYIHNKINSLNNSIIIKDQRKNNKQIKTSNNNSVVDLKKSEQQSKIKNIHLVRSDLYSNLNFLKAKFDIISFNPPYLPDEKNKKDNDIALNGGKQGYETIIKFLENSKDYLKKDGFILLLFSSKSKKNIIFQKAKALNYSCSLLAKKGLFFEKLYVYKIKPSEYFLAQGKRGKIYFFEKNNEKFIRKMALKESKAMGNIENEARFNQLLNKHDIGPKFISYNKENNSLIREFIEGEFLGDYLISHLEKEIISVLKKILLLMLELDSLKINKQEMTNPYKNIIVTNNGVPELIDFERCRFSQTPKNTTQFLQYLSSNPLKLILKKKKINFNRQETMRISKKYKETYNKNLILEFIKKL